MAKHHLAFRVILGWTLGLLFLGSVVHATESSLACPDWPTCYGSMFPEMTGGVFWEHLHRLVAGGLVILFVAAAWLVSRESANRQWVVRGSVVGIALLIVQSVLGGVTVLMRLPDAVSSAHLTLAFLFLALTTVLMVVTGPGWGRGRGQDDPDRGPLRRVAVAVAALVLFQSVLGAVVRHTDAGMACPDVPLCLGRVVPAFDHPLVILHFSHRAMGVLLTLATLALAALVLRDYAEPRLRRLAVGAVVAVVTQVTLGFLSVAESLAVLPVSLHTLVAAVLLSIVVALGTYGWESRPTATGDGQGVGVGAPRASRVGR